MIGDELPPRPVDLAPVEDAMIGVRIMRDLAVAAPPWLVGQVTPCTADRCPDGAHVLDEETLAHVTRSLLTAERLLAPSEPVDGSPRAASIVSGHEVAVCPSVDLERGVGEAVVARVLLADGRAITLAWAELADARRFHADLGSIVAAAERRGRA